MHFKHALVGAAVIGDHQDQLGVEIGAQQFGQARRIAARDLEVQLVAAQDAACRSCGSLRVVGQDGLENEIESTVMPSSRETMLRRSG